MPLPRMTTRRWLIVVALVALALGAETLRERRQMYLSEADMHAFWERRFDPQFVGDWFGPGLNDARRQRYHGRLRLKYERAARSPWLLVAPDPLPPD